MMQTILLKPKNGQLRAAVLLSALFHLLAIAAYSQWNPEIKTTPLQERPIRIKAVVEEPKTALETPPHTPPSPVSKTETPQTIMAKRTPHVAEKTPSFSAAKPLPAVPSTIATEFSEASLLRQPKPIAAFVNASAKPAIATQASPLKMTEARPKTPAKEPSVASGQAASLVSVQEFSSQPQFRSRTPRHPTQVAQAVAVALADSRPSAPRASGRSIRRPLGIKKLTNGHQAVSPTAVQMSEEIALRAPSTLHPVQVKSKPTGGSIIASRSPMLAAQTQKSTVPRQGRALRTVAQVPPEFRTETTGGLGTVQPQNMGQLRKGFSTEIWGRIAQAKYYPRIARDRGYEGQPVVAFTLDREGSLSALKLVEPSGHSILDRAAMEAVEKARPFPRIPEALNTNALQFKLPVTFVLENP